MPFSLPTKPEKPDLHGNSSLTAIPQQYLEGDQSDRLDGLDAAAITSNGDPAANNPNAKGNNRPEFLQRIVVFSKQKPDKPLKTVRFAYDNSLAGHLPNAIGAAGKLTLRKVWFEYEGIESALTLPYEFNYAHKPRQQFSDSLLKWYSYALTDSMYPDFDGHIQNPNYNAGSIDPWGNSVPFGSERKRCLIPWIYQGPLKWNSSRFANNSGWRNGTGLDNYDPGQWELKHIRLPSGAEIMVEYEQKDYCAVQDKLPMVMTTLIKSFEDDSQSHFWIEPTDLGLDLNAANYGSQLQSQCQLMNNYFKAINNKQANKLFFKFLYLLNSKYGSTASLDNCFSDYVSGYTDFDTATLDSSGLAFKTIKISLNKGYSSGKVPRSACYDYYTTRRFGMWDGSDCVAQFEKDNQSTIDNISNHESILGDAGAVNSMMGSMLAGPFLDISNYGIPDKARIGNKMNNALSYLKLPMLKAKKGGGVRVKRIMTYDAGLEGGDEALYGQEFDYKTFRKTTDGNYEVISSGVATNEPAGAKEESPLKVFLPKAAQTWQKKLVAGEDREQLEGPIGESLLPPAAVGHSRVVISSIHKGITGTGYSVHEFYTCQDFPFEWNYPKYDNTGQNGNAAGVSYTDINAGRNTSSFKLPLGVINLDFESASVRQGFEFRLNAMHGQQKAESDYNGDYHNYPVGTVVSEQQKNGATLVFSQEYNYYNLGEPVRVLYSDMTQQMVSLGQEEDVAVEQYNSNENAITFNLEFDISIDASFTIITPSVGFNFGITSQDLTSLSRAKIIRYPAILKSVTGFKDGVWTTKTNHAYDSKTGMVILAGTTDEMPAKSNIKSEVLNLTIPAWWVYPAFAADSINRLEESVLTLSSYGEADSLFSSSSWQFPKKILGASLTRYDNNWFSAAHLGSDSAGLGQYLLQEGIDNQVLPILNKIWLPKAHYVYKAPVTQGNFSVLMARTGWANSFDVTNVKEMSSSIKSLLDGSIDNSENWQLQERVVQYTINGQGREAENALHTRSFAHYGYQELVPILTGQDARVSETLFESYEDGKKGGNYGIAHTGSGCFKLNAGALAMLDTVQNGPEYQDANKGALIQFWSRASR